MKINKLILEQLSSRDQSKLNSLKASGYSEIPTRKYNSDKTKFDYESVGSGENIVYLEKAKVATNNNSNNNNNNNNNNSNNNNSNSNNNPPPAPATSGLNEYAGKYKTQSGDESEVKIDGEKLKVDVQGIPLKLTKTASKDLFDVSGAGLTGRCEFLRDSSGKVVGLSAEIGTHSIKASKVGVSSSSATAPGGSTPAINPSAGGSQPSGSFSGSVNGWPQCVQTTRQKIIFVITDKKDIPVTYFKDQAGADDFLTKNESKGYEVKKESCIFKFEDCDLDLQGPFSCEMYLRKNGTFVSDGEYKKGQWKCSERNRVQYFDIQLGEEKIRKNIRKGLNKLIK